tara:strand:+ start:8640 stop:9659 length:1020 start_codon:yes stop_codon:yes gene_type:complete
MDFRLKENRRESFIRWYAWSLKYKDCDPAVWMTNYLHERYEHNQEQKLWLAWLYGNTYYLPTAWVLINEFPDFELATVDRMEKWNSENYKRLRYQTDTKWNKGHLPSMFASYQEFIGEGTQRERFNSLKSSNPTKTFDNVWNNIKSNLHKFGRYSTWFYLQHLHHTAGIEMQPTSLMLNDYSGSRSHRNGLLFALGRDGDYDQKLTAKDYDRLEEESISILSEVRERYPELAKDADFFTMETCLCSFKKIFREHHGRYLGYYLDRQADEIKKVEKDSWYGIEWEVLWQSRRETIDSRTDHKRGVDKSLYSHFVKTGDVLRLDWMYNDLNEANFGLEKFF